MPDEQIELLLAAVHDVLGRLDLVATIQPFSLLRRASAATCLP
jgi:hypothetical protein